MAKKKDDEVFQVETPEVQPQPPQQQPLNVTIPIDIAISTVNLIDTMAQRGAFKGDELLTVGVIRQRMVETVAPYITPQG